MYRDISTHNILCKALEELNSDGTTYEVRIFRISSGGIRGKVRTVLTDGFITDWQGGQSPLYINMETGIATEILID